jgi:hypothetical protein
MVKITKAENFKGVKETWKVEFSNGDLYEGELTDNKIIGEGKLNLADGRVFEGRFLEGVLNGQGSLYDDKNKVNYKGKWLNG